MSNRVVRAQNKTLFVPWGRVLALIVLHVIAALIAVLLLSRLTLE